MSKLSQRSPIPVFPNLTYPNLTPTVRGATELNRRLQKQDLKAQLYNDLIEAVEGLNKAFYCVDTSVPYLSDIEAKLRRKSAKSTPVETPAIVASVRIRPKFTKIAAKFSFLLDEPGSELRSYCSEKIR